MQNFAGKTSPEQNAIIPERLVEQGQALSRPELNIKSQKGCQGSTLDVREPKKCKISLENISAGKMQACTGLDMDGRH